MIVKTQSNVQLQWEVSWKMDMVFEEWLEERGIFLDVDDETGGGLESVGELLDGLDDLDDMSLSL